LSVNFKDVGKYLRASVDTKAQHSSKGIVKWAEEGKKLSTFQRNVYPNSSPAQDAEKKRSE
jgi:hypothetical protein